MHEWALAEAVVSAAAKTAREHGLCEITGIRISLGRLQQVEMEIFEFAMNEIMQSQKALFMKTKIELQVEEAVLKCRRCGCKWSFGDVKEKLSLSESEAIHFIPEVAHAHICCPGCNSPDFELIQGRGVSIHSIQGKRDD